jgi:hypothetical protein
VIGRQRDQERLTAQVVALDAVMLAPRQAGVLERDRDVQLAARHALGHHLATGLLDQHLGVGLLGPQRSHRLGHEHHERARERADPQPDALRRDDLRQLSARQREPLGDRIRVVQQRLARRRQLQPAGLAREQLRADFLLQRGDLLGDRRLGERERASGRARTTARGRRRGT